MRTKVTTTINLERCIGCGLCVRVCPSRTLSLVDGKAAVTGTESIGCGHCAAVCPVGAVTVGALDSEMSRYDTFLPDDRWLPPGEPDLQGLVRLMASRRSCRNYRDVPVSAAQLSDLVKIACTAPSGTNSQAWTFTILSSRTAVLRLGEQVLHFFDGLNRLAAKGMVRHGLKLVGQGELDEYWRFYAPKVAQAIEEWRVNNRDRLFHGATAAVLIGATPEASTPAEDCLLAAQNLMLAAHAMGLGSCLIGFAVAAMRKDKRIASALGIPENEKIHAVVALGHPAERYARVGWRLSATVRSIEA